MAVWSLNRQAEVKPIQNNTKRPKPDWFRAFFVADLVCICGIDIRQPVRSRLAHDGDQSLLHLAAGIGVTHQERD